MSRPHRSFCSASHRTLLAYHDRSASSPNDNPPVPRTRPSTTIRLPPNTIAAYQRLLSLPPSSPLLHTTLSTFPPALLKKPYRKSFLPSFLFQTPIFKFFLERSRAKLPAEECCEVCPLHERLLEAPLVHLMGLIAYEMYTHLQSLMALHPAQRNGTTNQMLEKLQPWQQRKFFEPGSVVVGCLACELGRLYQDFRAMEALSVAAKSGRRQRSQVQLVDEGWLGWWADGRRGVKEVRIDRRIARTRGDNAVWRGGAEHGTAMSVLKWKEKRGFVLSEGPSRMARSSKSQRQSVRMEKPASAERPGRAAPPVRPNRPKGLTLFSKEETREGQRTAGQANRNTRFGQEIKRKPVPGARTQVHDREKKTASTATTVVASPRPHTKRHSNQPPAPAPFAHPSKNHRLTHSSRPPVALRPPPSSVYSRTQGFRPNSPTNDIRRTRSTIKPGIPTIASSQKQSHRLPSTQQTRWSAFQASRTPQASNPRAPSPSTHHPSSEIRQRTVPRRTKTMQALGRKVAAGEYEWWADSDFSDDEKVVVPSKSSASRTSRHHNTNTNTNDHYHHQNGKINVESEGIGSDESDGDSTSDYECDDDDEEGIHQRYLDEHEALLRMARGDGLRLGTKDYVDTLPERPMESTVRPTMSGREYRSKTELRRGGSVRREESMRRERSVRR
ncbi:MAG: hypothetical protein Q9182_007504 [Xanthomendoza sp. 2 TL-2023]